MLRKLNSLNTEGGRFSLRWLLEVAEESGAASADPSLLIRESLQESLKKYLKNNLTSSDLNSHYSLNSSSKDLNNSPECLNRNLSLAPQQSRNLNPRLLEEASLTYTR